LFNQGFCCFRFTAADLRLGFWLDIILSSTSIEHGVCALIASLPRRSTQPTSSHLIYHPVSNPCYPPAELQAVLNCELPMATASGKPQCGALLQTPR
jgi:hypothetical protein